MSLAITPVAYLMSPIRAKAAGGLQEGATISRNFMSKIFGMSLTRGRTSDTFPSIMIDNQYWRECIASGADECGLVLTDEQLRCLADAAECGHENYGQAFYSPPASDRIAVIEREWKDKLKVAETAAEKYRKNAETAIKQALGQRSDENVSIEEYGEVFRHGGRTVQIQ